MGGCVVKNLGAQQLVRPPLAVDPAVGSPVVAFGRLSQAATGVASPLSVDRLTVVSPAGASFGDTTSLYANNFLGLSAAVDSRVILFKGPVDSYAWYGIVSPEYEEF